MLSVHGVREPREVYDVSYVKMYVLKGMCDHWR